MRKNIVKQATDIDKKSIKHLKSKDLTSEKLFQLGGTKGNDVHLNKLIKGNRNKDYYT